MKNTATYSPLRHFKLYGFLLAFSCVVFTFWLELSTLHSPSPKISADSIQAYVVPFQFSKKETIFVTLSDSKFFNDTVYLLDILKHRQLILICLDKLCSKYCTKTSMNCFLSQEEDLASVRVVKFEAMTNLTMAGYPVLLFDADAFILRDPIPAMLPLDEATWDVQVQQDFYPLPLSLNFGWVFSKSTHTTRKLWNDCLVLVRQSKEWDQQIFNDVFLAAENEGTASLHRLPVDLFGSTHMMQISDLYAAHQPEMAIITRNWVVIHITCVEGKLKHYFAKILGAYPDKSYYCKNRNIIDMDAEFWKGHPKDIAGRLDALRKRLPGFSIIAPKYVQLVKNTASAPLETPFIQAFNITFYPEVLEFNFIHNAAWHCSEIVLRVDTEEVISLFTKTDIAKILSFQSDRRPILRVFRAAWGQINDYLPVLEVKRRDCFCSNLLQAHFSPNEFRCMRVCNSE